MWVNRCLRHAFLHGSIGGVNIRGDFFAERGMRQFLWGGAISLINIMIHALVMTAVVRVSHATATKTKLHPNLLLITVMVATVSVLMIAHFSEIIVWSLFYGILNAAPADADLLYFAFVNYTTLGYGDVLPAKSWHLLGPMTAMNGVLLFGWSTAVIFEVLRKIMRGRIPARDTNPI
jgi:Ion channel